MARIYSKGVSRILKIDSVERLRRDIVNEPIIKESMADVVVLMVGTFGRFLAPLLIVAHTANHTEGFKETENVVYQNAYKYTLQIIDVASR